MFYNIYTAVKNQLTTQIAALKGVEWYNVQYEGAIASTPRVFVEFPEKLEISQLTKQTRRAPLRMRLHVVSVAVASHEGVIPDSTAQEHETIALAAKDAIDKFTPLSGAEKLTTPMQLTGWQHFHKHKGWMVTFLEFDAKKML